LVDAMQQVPRRLFLPAGIDPLLANDVPVTLAQGRILSPVNLVRMMLQALELVGTERVLEIGGGSGYQAGLLSRLAREVHSIELDRALAENAKRALAELGCSNVRVIHGDASAGWPEGAPYQAIVVGVGAWEIPPELIEQLDLGGRLVIPVGDEDGQLIERLRKRADAMDSETLGACHLDMLVGERGSASFPWTHLGKA
jgi:protein-L-isoaspartate(D-aspartate) O-methyltransferase